MRKLKASGLFILKPSLGFGKAPGNTGDPFQNHRLLPGCIVEAQVTQLPLLHQGGGVEEGRRNADLVRELAKILKRY